MRIILLPRTARTGRWKYNIIMYYYNKHYTLCLSHAARKENEIKNQQIFIYFSPHYNNNNNNRNIVLREYVRGPARVCGNR